MTDRARSLLWWAAAAALVVVAVVTADWGKGASPAPPPVHRSHRLPSPSVVVHAVNLTRRDVPAGFREVTPRASSDLEPGDRLDLCGIPEPPEDRALVADRRAYVVPDGRRIRTEVVAYRPFGADRALSSLLALAATCARPVPPGPGEQPATLAMRVRTHGRLPGGLGEQLFVERRGNVLVLLQVDLRPGPLPLDLARLLSLRLETQIPDR